MSKAEIDQSYTAKLGFYLLALALPLVLMTAVVMLAPGGILSPMSPDPSKFLFFVLYFLPGLIMARSMTQSWRRTLGVGVAYVFLSPAYYYYAADYARKIAGNCVAV